MINIIEFIDGLLPQNEINISFLSLPNELGMLIEETGIKGQINSFYGYDGVISSTIQFYVRVAPTDMTYRKIGALLKRFYKIVQANMGVRIDNIQLLYAGQFDLTPNMRDEKNNYVFSLMFPVIYKDWS